jgi:hypothetical protein
MAMDILSIPAINDKLKRVFSGARRTISWEKTQLEVENIKKNRIFEILKSKWYFKEKFYNLVIVR